MSTVNPGQPGNTEIRRGFGSTLPDQQPRPRPQSQHHHHHQHQQPHGQHPHHQAHGHPHHHHHHHHHHPHHHHHHHHHNHQHHQAHAGMQPAAYYPQQYQSQAAMQQFYFRPHGANHVHAQHQHAHPFHPMGGKGAPNGVVPAAQPPAPQHDEMKDLVKAKEPWRRKGQDPAPQPQQQPQQPPQQQPQQPQQHQQQHQQHHHHHHHHHHNFHHQQPLPQQPEPPQQTAAQVARANPPPQATPAPAEPNPVALAASGLGGGPKRYVPPSKRNKEQNLERDAIREKENQRRREEEEARRKEQEAREQFEREQRDELLKDSQLFYDQCWELVEQEFVEYTNEAKAAQESCDNEVNLLKQEEAKKFDVFTFRLATVEEGVGTTFSEAAVLTAVAPNSQAAKCGMSEHIGQTCRICCGVEVSTKEDIDASLAERTVVSFKLEKVPDFPPADLEGLRQKMGRVVSEAENIEKAIAYCASPTDTVKYAFTLLKKAPEAKTAMGKLLEAAGLSTGTHVMRYSLEDTAYIVASMISIFQMDHREILAVFKANANIEDDEVDVCQEKYEQTKREVEEERLRIESEKKAAEEESRRKAEKLREEELRAKAEREKERENRPELANGRHPLHSKWALWYTGPPKDPKEWVTATKMCVVSDLEEFWATTDSVPKASSLEVKASYAFFREGISPDWDDEVNMAGGQLHVTFKTNMIDECWSSLMMSCAGECLSNYGSRICGVKIVRWPANCRLELWIRKADVECYVKKGISPDLKKILHRYLPKTNYVKYMSTSALKSGEKNGIIV